MVNALNVRSEPSDKVEGERMKRKRKKKERTVCVKCVMCVCLLPTPTQAAFWLIKCDQFDQRQVNK